MPTRSITVRVRDPDGKAIAGAWVEGQHGRIMADREGRATMRVDAGETSLVVGAPSHATSRFPIGSGDLVAELAAGGRLSGTVIDDLGAHVQAARVDCGTDRFMQHVHADEEGHFSFEGVPFGEVRCRVAAVDHEDVERVVRWVRDTPSLRIQARRVGRLEGRVADTEDGPVQGARVRVAGSGVWPPREVVSDAQGAFVFSGLPAGVYEVRATEGAFVADPIEGLAIDPGRAAHADLVLREGIVVAGRVLDAASGQGVAGAEITIAEESLTFVARPVTTDARGDFSVRGLRAVPHHIAIRARGYAALMASSEEGAAQERGDARTFALLRTSTLRGRVVDGRGVPIEGAEVEIRGTGSDGAALVAYTPARFSAFAPAAGNELPVVQGPVPPIPTSPRAPTADAVLHEALGEEGPIAAIPRTSAEGTFVISDVSPGMIELAVRRAGFGTAYLAARRVRPGAEIASIEVTLEAAASVEGRVTDARGFAAKRVRVTLEAAHERWPRSVLADDDGAFRFEDVVGRAEVSAHPMVGPVTVAEVETVPGTVARVTLELEVALNTMAGRVVDARGFAIGGARVRVRSNRDRVRLQRTAQTDDNGEFEFAEIPNGPWTLDVDDDAHASVSVRTADLAPRVVLPEGARISGSVTDEAGAPIAGVEIKVRADRQSAFTTRTDTEGNFATERLAAATYSVSFSAPNFLDKAQEISIASSARGLEDFALETVTLIREARVEGTVTDPFGTPIEDAEVSVEGGARARTDARGIFSLGGLSEGTHVVRARHAQAGEAAARDAIRVAAGETVREIAIGLPRRADRDRPGSD